MTLNLSQFWDLAGGGRHWSHQSTATGLFSVPDLLHLRTAVLKTTGCHQALKNQKAVEVKCFSQGDEISSLKMKLNQKERDLEELKTGYNDVEDSSRIYREERDLYRLTLRDTAQNLEQARRQNDATVQGYKKTLDSKETTIQQQEEHMLQIEKKYEESKEKLASAKLKLKQQEEKNEELSKKISILEVQLQEKVMKFYGYCESILP